MPTHSTLNHKNAGPAPIEIRPDFANQALQVVADAIASGADASLISSALCGLYLDALQRVLKVRSDFDRARELQGVNEIGWDKASRVIRFACDDEERFLGLVEQGIRGLNDCLALKTRISFECIAKMSERRKHDSPEERTRDLFMLTMLKKAILYNCAIPAEYLLDGMEDQLEVCLNRQIEKGGMASLEGGEAYRVAPKLDSAL